MVRSLLPARTFVGLLLCAAPAAILAAQQAAAPQPQAPAASESKPAAKAAAKAANTAEDNPFPEDISKQAAAAAAADEKADRKAASSGSVAAKDADQDDNSSRDKFKDLDLLGDHDSRISNGAGGIVVNTKLSDDDVRVGVFYMQTGDYQGAYERLKEAVLVNPDNAEAVFRLGEAARKLNKKDEALANFEIYLTALPDGPRAKTARKAISELAKK
jgi:tetratricopeptide (TPR) repeat protein